MKQGDFLSESINIRVTAEEKDMAAKLALYLHKKGKIPKSSLSDALRMSLHFTVNEILKAIEVERYQ